MKLKYQWDGKTTTTTTTSVEMKDASRVELQIVIFYCHKLIAVAIAMDEAGEPVFEPQTITK